LVPYTFISASSGTAVVGFPFSFTFKTYGSPPAKIKKHGALPRGFKLHSNGDGTATLWGTATGKEIGNYSFSAIATFGKGKTKVVTTVVYSLAVS